MVLHKTDRIHGSRDKCFRIHRIVALTFIDNPDNRPCVDHIDRNKMNNCVSNLRWATYNQNNTNRVSCPNSVSKYKGVTLHKCGKWQSAIRGNGKYLYIGIFNNEIDAAKAYNDAVDRYFPGSEFHYKNIF